MSDETSVRKVRMTPFVKLTSSQRIGVTILLPHDSEKVTKEEALEIADILEGFASAYRRGVDLALAFERTSSKGGVA